MNTLEFETSYLRQMLDEYIETGKITKNHYALSPTGKVYTPEMIGDELVYWNIFEGSLTMTPVMVVIMETYEDRLVFRIEKRGMTKRFTYLVTKDENGKIKLVYQGRPEIELMSDIN